MADAPAFAELIEITHRQGDGVSSLKIDGVEFPWAILTDVTLDLSYGMPGSVTVTIPAQRVQVTQDDAPCSDHLLVQHRDGKPPWCKTCRRTASGALIPRR